MNSVLVLIKVATNEFDEIYTEPIAVCATEAGVCDFMHEHYPTVAQERVMQLANEHYVVLSEPDEQIDEYGEYGLYEGFIHGFEIKKFEEIQR